MGTYHPKEAEAEIWDKMCVDLIGPYKIRRKEKLDLVCKCVTMIDLVSGWFEIHQYHDKRVTGVQGKISVMCIPLIGYHLVTLENWNILEELIYLCKPRSGI